MSEITQEDYQTAADIAERAEAVAFSGNDVAALRLGIAGDDEILGFVRLVAQVRLAARERAIEEAAQVAQAAGVYWVATAIRALNQHKEG